MSVSTISSISGSTPAWCDVAEHVGPARHICAATRWAAWRRIHSCPRKCSLEWICNRMPLAAQSSDSRASVSGVLPMKELQQTDGAIVSCPAQSSICARTTASISGQLLLPCPVPISPENSSSPQAETSRTPVSSAARCTPAFFPARLGHSLRPW